MEHLTTTSTRGEEDRSVEDETAAEIACTDVDVAVDIEMGTNLPVIELPSFRGDEAASGELAAAVVDRVASISSSDNYAETVIAAVVEAPSNADGMISPEVLESSPIAHLVQQCDCCSDGVVCCVSNSSTTSATTAEDCRSVPLLERRAEFISATIIKDAESTTPIGLGLTCEKGEVLISSITPGTLAANTPFHVGDRLLSVNTKRCYIMDDKEVLQFMASLVGVITIVVHSSNGDPNLVESMITKPTPDSRCGMGLVSSGRRFLKISNIDQGGLFFDSLLNVGDPIISINGEDCEFIDAQDAGEIIGQARKYITVKARTLLETGVVVAAFSCNNSTGSTIPPQIINAMDQSLQANQPSKAQLAALTFAVVILISLILITGVVN